ncbi:MAG: hypothetical protein KAG10_03355, partial [Methylococcales bacterium]|nr:hypothetical protein [Methylococcales bacterium]
MNMSFKLTLNTVLLGGALFASSSVFATDKELLDTLLKNGVLTKAQHEKLISQADKKAPKKTTKASGSILDM